MATARSARAAFSLVEVLVALMIVSGIMLALTQLLEATRISRDTIHNIQETQLAGPAIMDLIERDLRGIFLYDREADQSLRVKNRVLLGRDADRVDFVTTTDSVVLTEADRRLVRADVNEVGYALRLSPSDDEFLELYRREDFGIDEEPFDGGTYTFLHDHVKNFEIQIYEEDGQDVEGIDDWGDDEEHTGLPRRIEIRLTLELAPRLSHEQLRIAPVDKRIVTYTRIVRFSEDLLTQLEIQPVPVVPAMVAAQDNSSAGNANNNANGGGGGGMPGGGGQGGGGRGGGTGGGSTRGGGVGGAQGAPVGGGGGGTRGGG
jgi:prepilin-type N-terminal cleavage/methylation domain-containing protein